MVNNSTIAGCLGKVKPPFYLYDGDRIAEKIARVQRRFRNFPFIFGKTES